MYDRENKDSATKDPVFAKLITLLTGSPTDKPAKVPAKILWLRESGHKDAIDQEHKKAVEYWATTRPAVLTSKDKAAPLRLHNQIVTREWNKLSVTERGEWEERSTRLHKEAVRLWVEETVDFSDEPAERQRYDFPRICLHGILMALVQVHKQRYLFPSAHLGCCQRSNWMGSHSDGWWT